MGLTSSYRGHAFSGASGEEASLLLLAGACWACLLLLSSDTMVSLDPDMVFELESKENIEGTYNSPYIIRLLPGEHHLPLPNRHPLLTQIGEFASIDIADVPGRG